jgi:general stress protein CsbA
MNTQVNPVLFWTPRILTIAFAGFMGLFATDAFTGEGNAIHVMDSFLMHLIPALIIVLMLGLSWKREWIGGLTFIVMAIAYALYAYNHLLWILIISSPLFIIGVLFLAVWIQKNKRKEI